MTRILVTGSRDWNDIIPMMDALYPEFQADPLATLIHGGARGADTMAGNIWAVWGGKQEVHPANWAEHGKKAGFLRNREMVDLGADKCLAFIKNESKGATMCADLAEKAGIETVRYLA